MPPSETLQGICVEPGASIHGRNKFSSRFVFNISQISANIKNRLNTCLIPLGLSIFFPFNFKWMSSKIIKTSEK